MTPQRLNILTAVCLLAAGVMTFIDEGLVARVVGAVLLFGAGMAVAEARRRAQPATRA